MTETTKTRLSRPRDEIVAEARELGILLPGVGRLISEMESLRVQTACGRCGGGGHYSYNPTDGTICFGCRGSGKGDIVPLDNYVKNMQARERRENKARRDIVAAAEAMDARMSDIPAVLNRAAAALGYSGAESLWSDAQGKYESETTREISFVSKMVSVIRRGAELSEKQEAYVESIPTILQEREDKKSRRQEAGFLGDVGEKFEVEAQLFFARTLENDWGTTTMAKFETDEGHIITWFASGYRDDIMVVEADDDGEYEFESQRQKMRWETREDQSVVNARRVTLKGTIKKQEVYQGSPQTVVTRCKLGEVA